MSTDKICPMCGATYGQDHVFCPRDSSALRATEDADGLVGSVVGSRYLITERIGAGGMGEVYKGQDVRLQRVVAVKVLRSNLAGDSDAVARVIREAANGAKIRNQHVVDIFDYGETDEGRPFIVMEFISGESLRVLIEREGRLEPRRVATLLLQIADGLNAAHRLGIVHRDVKPDNVLVHAGTNGADLVKIVDFGISRAVRDESQHLTQSGFITGTCEFMSPEQITGRVPDHRTDIYALGLVVFMMLSGSLPFAGDTPEMAMLVRLRESPRRLDQALPSVQWPPALQDALDRALAFDASSRFGSVGDFAQAVDSSVNARVGAKPATPGSRIRWKGRAVAGGAVAVMALGALVVYHLPRVERMVKASASRRTEELMLQPARYLASASAETAAELDSYKDILLPGLTADSARQAIVSLYLLLRWLPTRHDSVEADIHRAEAHVLAGDNKKACAILENSLPYANSLQRHKINLRGGRGLCKQSDL